MFRFIYSGVRSVSASHCEALFALCQILPLLSLWLVRTLRTSTRLSMRKVAKLSSLWTKYQAFRVCVRDNFSLVQLEPVCCCQQKDYGHTSCSNHSPNCVMQGAPVHWHSSAVNSLFYGRKRWVVTEPEDALYVQRPLLEHLQTQHSFALSPFV